MRTMLTTVLVGTLVLALAAGASAAVIWDGGQDPGTLADYGFDRAGNEGCFTWPDDPGIMHQDSIGYTAAQWSHRDFGGGEMTRAVGWFIQTRLEALSSTGNYGVCVGVGDDVGYVHLDFTPDLVSIIAGGSGFCGLTAGYHTIKVAMPAGGTSFDIYVDDMDTPVLFADGTAFVNSATFFADGTDSAGGEANWDYFYVNHSGGTPEPIPGDANLDNVVNDADASILAAHWQQTGMGWGDGDFNGDTNVNDADASILAAHWQETQEGIAPVPEPSVLVLLFGAGLIGLLARARRRR